MNCIKDGKYTGDSCFGCPVKVDECEIRDKVYRKRWIPVVERLPENGEESVLIQVSGRPRVNISLDNALEIATYNKYEGWILENWPEWEGAEVIAWMPLPEPYKPD